MRTLFYASMSLYSLVLLFCAFLCAEAVIPRGRGSLKRENAWIMTAVCVAAVTVFYLLKQNTLSGDYVIHIAFAISPVFIHRLVGLKIGLSIIPSASVLCVIAVAVAVSFLCRIPLDTRGPTLLLLSAVLIILVGKAIWRHSDIMRKSDGALTAKETMDDFADILYFMILLFVAATAMFTAHRPCWGAAAGSLACLLLMAGLVVALYIRRREGRAFVLCRRREDAFMDNFRPYAAFSRKDAAKLNASCENLFMRLNEYFEDKKPYLDPNLTMTDMAKILLTNKMYLSRTINECTGRNFCQFVNYYRIRYAVELFRGNNSYKIAELSKLSGFNSVRSFMMAFRLYMNVSPSQWCRVNRGGYAGTEPRDRAAD